MHCHWILVVAAIAVGCASKREDGNVLPIAPSFPPTASPLPLVTTAVDAQGGTAKVNDPNSDYDGTSVTIPAGAIAQPITFTIDTAQLLPVGTLPVEFRPHGTTFAKPVPLTLPYAVTLLQELGKSDDAKDLMVVSRDANGNIEVHPTQQVGVRSVDTTTTHFGIFEVLFPRHYTWFRQPDRLIDETPESFEVGITHLKGSLPIVTTEYHPILTQGPSNQTIVLGKGTLTDFFASSQGNVLLIHGFISSPMVFYFDEQMRVNDNDLALSLRNATGYKGLFQNIVLYQYPSGWTIASNAEKLDALVRKNKKPGFKMTIIAHSMGGLVARYAIESLDLSQYVDKLITTGTPHEGGQLNYIADYYADSGFLSVPARTIIPIPGLNDLLPGNSFFKPLVGKGINERFPDRKLPMTEYYLIAGKKAGVGDDGLVTVGSALSSFLNVPIAHQYIVDNITHWELHGNAKKNGVLMKIREWMTNQPNRAPIVDAGADQTVTVNTQVTLTGSATDPDLDAIACVWAQTAGPTAPLSSTTTLTATFTPTQAGVYMFTLTANDTGVTGTDSVTVTVNIPAPTPAPAPAPLTQQRTVYPVYDTHSGEQAYNGLNPNRNTWPNLIVGYSGGNNFWTRVSFDPVSTIVPPNATITKATFTIHEKNVLQSGTVTIEIGGGVWLSHATGGSSSIDVTSEFTKLLSSPSAKLPLFSFLISSGNAHLEYYSSESGSTTTPSFAIEWQ